MTDRALSVSVKRCELAAPFGIRASSYSLSDLTVKLTTLGTDDSNFRRKRTEKKSSS